MFCPRCAADNLDDAKYCRGCGADIHLVPQALTGLLAADAAKAGDKPAKKSKKKDEEGKLLEKGMENIFVGLAFLVIFLGGLLYMRGAFFLWVWFIIPSLAGFGEGLGQLLRSRREHRLLMARARSGELGAAAARPLFAPPQPARTLAAPDTAEIVESPFSVTEATTRHLDSRAGNVRNEY
ncbi:MAG TPA: zinc ribbon domain-containing protein [Pyrinomonadaceae bacterium]|nr:zinc ribbon domain-containing protein [Pyrinomonadaceae bacterium]